jgi:hypothetical protein
LGERFEVQRISVKTLGRAGEAREVSFRIKVLLPNRDSIKSTANSAVQLLSSNFALWAAADKHMVLVTTFAQLEVSGADLGITLSGIEGQGSIVLGVHG